MVMMRGVDYVSFFFIALNKSRNKHHRGRRRNSSKKTKNDKRGTLGNSLYTVMAFVLRQQILGQCM